MIIELGEFQIHVSNIDYRPEEPANLRGHPDNWHDGVGAELTYDVDSVTRFGEEQDDITILTKEEREEWLSKHYEDLDAAVLEVL